MLVDLTAVRQNTGRFKIFYQSHIKFSHQYHHSITNVFWLVSSSKVYCEVGISGICFLYRSNHTTTILNDNYTKIESKQSAYIINYIRRWNLNVKA